MKNYMPYKLRVLLVLILITVPLLSYAQSRFIIEPVAEEYPTSTIIVETATMFFGQNYTELEYGTRFDQPSAISLHRLDCSSGQPFSSSIIENVWKGGPFTPTKKVGLKVGFRTKGDFVGALTLTFFARTPGSTTDLFTKSVTVSIGSLPAPAMSYPKPNENLSPAPVFQGSLTTLYPQNVSYEIEMDGPTARTISIPTQLTGTQFSSFTPEIAGFQPGTYNWRVRTLDARGKAGPWSNPTTNPIYGGIDMAGSASTTFLNTMRSAGWSTFYAASWGGRNIWSPAQTNLIRASNAGFKVAAYAFLNFDNSSTIAGAPANQTGQWQVDQGLRAIGYNTNKTSLPYDLKYFMVDIENAYQGTMAPEDRVQRIAEAVQHVRNLGFWPMIYTRNEGFNLWWNQYTGSSTDFRELWLWDSKPQLITHPYKDHLTLSNSGPWVPYGGWEVRGGKQYLLDQQVAGGRVDFNVWDPAVWENVNSPDPGFINITPADVTVIREANNDYKVTVTLRNTGNIEAYAVRLGDAQLGSQLVTGRQTLGMITPNGSRAGVYTFPPSSGTPGTFAQLQFIVWTGNGPQTQGVMVSLP
jgi:hypothetical protein